MSDYQEMTQPGVSFSQQAFDIAQQEKPSAMPLFIGYAAQECIGEELIEINSLKEFTQKCVTNSGTLHDALNMYFIHGGSTCFVLPIIKSNYPEYNAGDFNDIGEVIASEPLITLLVIPDIVEFDNTSWLKVVDTVRECCKRNLNLFALIDFPEEAQSAGVFCRSLTGDGLENMAGYWPWLRIRDDDATRANRSRAVELKGAVPPCAAVAAMYQLNDKTRGIWRAPANIRLEQVIQTSLDEHTRFPLFSADPRQGRSVNQIRSFPGRGIKVWGCRTLSDQNETSKLYVQNQRLLKWIKATLKDAMRPYVYEPNNEVTWYRLHALIRRHLKTLWQKGGLAGQTEDEAWVISIGIDESMTAAEIDEGILRCRVAVALQQPAEFVYINLDFWLGTTVAESREVIL